MNNIATVLQGLSVPEDYEYFFDLEAEQQKTLIRHFARYYPSSRKYRWSCCGSQSQHHVDKTTVPRASRCAFVRNNGKWIPNVAQVLGYEKDKQQQSSVKSERIDIRHMEKKVDDVLQRLANLENHLRESYSVPSSPIPARTESKRSSAEIWEEEPIRGILREYPEKSLARNRRQDSTRSLPSQSGERKFVPAQKAKKKTLEDVCREFTGYSLFSPDDAEGMCRWPEEDMHENKVRCNRRANSQGDLCQFHAKAVAAEL